MKIGQFASVFILVFLGLVWNAKAQGENAILGLWYNTEKTAQVEIMKSGSQFIGKITWLKDPNPEGKQALDKENSDPKLRSRPLMGLAILDGLKYSGGLWKGGEIYDPKNGKTYSCEVKLKSDKILEVKGYIGFSFVGRTVEWTRIK
ncbi:hypothetical protein SAMN03080617_02048 [Algoriphagus alkaliphilus]|uniref:DUF2147 domain-containing protein n=1 Tax=Algoriphagus alkaliphilus TaxID=279824 RepID=A0A1G5XY36_9BACT|nr:MULTISPECIES: DUF2147 domain-containing protein [Algoriphagus]MBA4299158.1 DUF2147 domain-containing protein [Cyclobacterium sp.]MDP2042317.1 DUF2147 domain-containing protein [Algoriphagus sp.]MDP3471045.1 DUF2147 domain-containing protein [Algoriphagus sp.]SDA74567.1 hypothetical protein SAMN03080617_02048 [Algoriphagus alkaliphilus]